MTESERRIQRGIQHLEQMAEADWKIEFDVLKWVMAQTGATLEEATIAWNSTDRGKLPPFIRFNPTSPNENEMTKEEIEYIATTMMGCPEHE